MWQIFPNVYATVAVCWSHVVLRAPHRTEGILLKDHMLGSTTSVHKKHRPTVGSSLEWTSPLALFPVSDTQESLNLSPSLLNSPARGVTSLLLPEGQDYLQGVWKTSTRTKTFRHTMVFQVFFFFFINIFFACSTIWRCLGQPQSQPRQSSQLAGTCPGWSGRAHSNFFHRRGGTPMVNMAAFEVPCCRQWHLNPTPGPPAEEWRGAGFSEGWRGLKLEPYTAGPFMQKKIHRQ